MARQPCPRCSGDRATIVMLPGTRDGKEPRPHPAFRCMACDTQWADDEQWKRLHETTEDTGQ